MCHNGKKECIGTKDVQKKLNEKGNHWKIGSCSSVSGITINGPEDIEMYGKEHSIPLQYKLSNYPNPFVGTTTIKYELLFDSKVSIKVYDLMGRVVATLVDEDKKAGTHTVDFKAGHMSKGSLYYRIIAKSKDKQFKQTNKMIQLQ